MLLYLVILNRQTTCTLSIFMAHEQKLHYSLTPLINVSFIEHQTGPSSWTSGRGTPKGCVHLCVCVYVCAFVCGYVCMCVYIWVCTTIQSSTTLLVPMLIVKDDQTVIASPQDLKSIMTHLTRFWILHVYTCVQGYSVGVIKIHILYCIVW